MSISPLIAIVDDDLAMREALQDLLRSCGYTTCGFASAEAYMSRTQTEKFESMILDVRMPGMSGLELQAALNAEGSAPPIIFMTSYFDDYTRSTAMNGGAIAFLGKPVDDEVLLKSLRDAIATFHA